MKIKIFALALLLLANAAGAAGVFSQAHNGTASLYQSSVTGTLFTSPLQAGPDGLIYVLDDFTDLGGQSSHILSPSE